MSHATVAYSINAEKLPDLDTSIMCLDVYTYLIENTIKCIELCCMLHVLCAAGLEFPILRAIVLPNQIS